MSQKIVDKKEKKDQIILSAINAFVEKGFERTTINDIASKVGIGKGTVYEYFKSKEEIIDQSFRYFINSIDIDFEKILLSEVKAKEKLGMLLKSLTDFINPESDHLIKLMMNFWGEAMRSQDAKNIILNDMKKFYHSFRSVFEDIIIEGIEDGSFRKDVDPKQFAVMIIGMLDGILIQWMLDKDEVNSKKILFVLKPIIFNGILND